MEFSCGDYLGKLR